MNDIVNTIIKVEGECTRKIDAARSEGENVINNLRIQIENKKKEEMKSIATENNDRYKSEVGRAEGEMGVDLVRLKEYLGRLRENNELCNEVREKIISLILTEL